MILIPRSLFVSCFKSGQLDVLGRAARGEYVFKNIIFFDIFQTSLMLCFSISPIVMEFIIHKQALIRIEIKLFLGRLDPDQYPLTLEHWHLVNGLVLYHHLGAPRHGSFI